MTTFDFPFEISTDLKEATELRELDARHRQNSDWLQSHWIDFLPTARGKFIAVADEMGFVASTAQEAWDWVSQTHPNDRGAIVRHVRLQEGPRIYGHRR